jgi:hypothetical protein
MIALADPMTKRLARPWEEVFSSALPQNLDILGAALAQSLKSFRLQMAERPELKKAPSFALVARQVEMLEQILNDTVQFKETVNTGQKKANRRLVPAIASGMAGAYTHCVEERGKPTCRNLLSYRY